MFLRGEIRSHAHVMEDNFPLPIAERGWVSDVVASNAVLCPQFRTAVDTWGDAVS